MTTRLPPGGIYSPRPGNNIHITHMTPAPGDLFCCVTVNGDLALTRTIDRHHQVLTWLDGFAYAQPTQAKPVVIKVLCLTLHEMVRFGFVSADALAAGRADPERDAEDRQFVLNTLWRLVRESNTRDVRNDALKLLREFGGLQ